MNRPPDEAALPARPDSFWGPVHGIPDSDRLSEHHEVIVVGAGITGCPPRCCWLNAGSMWL